MKKKSSRKYCFVGFIFGLMLFFVGPITSYGGGAGVHKGLLKQYSDNWWQWSLSIPLEVHPLFDNDGRYCAVGQHGDVWFLGGTLDGSSVERSCTIPYGKKIFFPVINAECSTIEGSGESKDELKACASDLMDHVTEIDVSINGVSLKNIEKARVQSKPFAFSLPPSDILGLFGEEPNPSLAVSDGWWVYLPPLPVGNHTIEIYGVAPFPEWSWTFVQDVRYNITIVSP